MATSRQRSRGRSAPPAVDSRPRQTLDCWKWRPERLRARAAVRIRQSVGRLPSDYFFLETWMLQSGVLGSGWWGPLVFVMVAGHLTNVCVTLYLHRAQTHRGVQLHHVVSIPMRFWLWLTTAIVTKEWVACHRKHHAFADRDGDPHSPLLEGLRNILLKGAFYYRRAVRQPGILDKYGRGTPNDWLERNLFTRLNWLGPTVMLAADVVLFGAVAGSIVWAAQMLWIPFWAAGVVNGLGHALGYRNFDVKDESRNISPLAIWLAGEELHNNHHADPRSARFSARWFEFDIGWVYIRALAALRLAKVVHARANDGGQAKSDVRQLRTVA